MALRANSRTHVTVYLGFASSLDLTSRRLTRLHRIACDIFAAPEE